MGLSDKDIVALSGGHTLVGLKIWSSFLGFFCGGSTKDGDAVLTSYCMILMNVLCVWE